MSEEAPDEVMLEIMYLEGHKDYLGRADSVLRHLYELHKLRDEKLKYELCLCFPLGDAQFWEIHAD